MSSDIKYKFSRNLVLSKRTGSTARIELNDIPLVGAGFIPPGKVLYVDSRSWGVGSAGNDGLDPNHPLATIGAAVGKCIAGKNDYIFCIDGFDNDAATITVNISSVHIIGVGSNNHRAPFVWLKIAGTGAAAVFTLQGSNSSACEIAGFTLGAKSDKPCITTVTGGSTELVYAWIHNCTFAASLDAAFVAQDGILEADGTGLDGTLVEDCTFGAQLTRDGIRFKNMYQGMIRNCRFDRVGVKSIDAITGGAATGMPDVIDCRFSNVLTSAEGWAITTMDSGAGLIDGNRASADFAANDYNPYLDHNDLNFWGLNYSAQTVTYPATT